MTRTYSDFYTNKLDDAIMFQPSDYINHFDVYFDTDITEKCLFDQKNTNDYFYLQRKDGISFFYKKTQYGLMYGRVFRKRFN